MAELINGASLVDMGALKFSQGEYRNQLRQTLIDALLELEGKNHLLAASILREGQWDDGPVPPHLFSLWPRGGGELSPAFIDAVSRGNDFSNAKSLAETYLRQGLEEMPVGISIQSQHILGNPSTLRFGDYHFYSAFAIQGYAPRDVWKRGSFFSKRTPTNIDVELNIPRNKKKLMAIRLDRNHRALDHFYGYPTRSWACLHTCGSYPPLFLIRNGVPIISPDYLLPSPPALSLAVQKFLGSPLVKNISMGPNHGPTGLLPLIIHDSWVILVIELPTFASAIYLMVSIVERYIIEE